MPLHSEPWPWMMRGEKRPSDALDDPQSGPINPNAGPSSSRRATKRAKEPKDKIPEFDWNADNHALTWKLVTELCKPENVRVLFPNPDAGTKVRLCFPLLLYNIELRFCCIAIATCRGDEGGCIQADRKCCRP